MVSVSVESLTITLGGRAVVQDVSAVLEARALIGIVGPNGAGKSTLLRAMLGLIPVQRGSVSIDGQPITQIARRDVARTLAYLPQGQVLHWPLTVERLVALGRLPHLAPMSGIDTADAAAIERAMAQAAVRPQRHRPATELSGGERARVLLARTLAVEARGLVADEPLASLDPGHQIDVMELLLREARGGALVVTVLHDLTMAARYCDRLLLMDGGRLIADGAPANVLTADRLADVYGIRALVDSRGPAPLIVPLERS